MLLLFLWFIKYCLSKPSLSANDIDMQVLPTLAEDDLREIGVRSFGLRRKLRIVCEEMTKSEALLVPDTDGVSSGTLNTVVLLQK